MQHNVLLLVRDSRIQLAAPHTDTSTCLLSDRQLCRKKPPLPLQILLAYKKSRKFFLLLPSSPFSPSPSLAPPPSNINTCTFMKQRLLNEAAGPHVFPPPFNHLPPCLTRQKRGKESQRVLSPDHRQLHYAKMLQPFLSSSSSPTALQALVHLNRAQEIHLHFQQQVRTANVAAGASPSCQLRCSAPAWLTQPHALAPSPQLALPQGPALPVPRALPERPASTLTERNSADFLSGSAQKQESRA